MTNELTQILQKEQEQKELVEEAKTDAQAEIEKQKEILEDSFNKQAVLTAEEKQEIAKKQNLAQARIGEQTEKELQAGLKELKHKEEKNFKKAVDYIVNNFLN